MDNGLLGALGHLAEAMTEASEPEQVLSALVSEARGLLPYSAAALALRGPEGWRVWRSTTARPAAVTLNAAIPAPAAETLERFLSHGHLLRINDLLGAPWSDSTHRGILWKDGTRSALLVPLVAARRPLGALSFTSARPDQYPDAKQPLATFLAWMVAHTLRALATEGAERSNDERS